MEVSRQERDTLIEVLDRGGKSLYVGQRAIDTGCSARRISNIVGHTAGVERALARLKAVLGPLRKAMDETRASKAIHIDSQPSQPPASLYSCKLPRAGVYGWQQLRVAPTSL